MMVNVSIAAKDGALLRFVKPGELRYQEQTIKAPNAYKVYHILPSFIHFILRL